MAARSAKSPETLDLLLREMENREHRYPPGVRFALSRHPRRAVFHNESRRMAVSDHSKQDGTARRHRLTRHAAHDIVDPDVRSSASGGTMTRWLRHAGRSVAITSAVDERARFLSGLGFGALDALHLACAENAQARWFVTTDDRLIRKALEQRDQVQLEVVRPDQLAVDAEEDGK